MSKRILVILGHPARHSLCAELANTYVEAARGAGNDVRLLCLGKMQFDPVLHEGYQKVQPLEPDLVTAQQALTWAEHVVLVYPLWWSAAPALLKGFFDRILLPGFAFKYRNDSVRCDRLLQGRTARLIVTMDNPPWYYRWLRGAPGVRQIQRDTLAFCGIAPAPVTCFGPVQGATAAQRDGWLATVRRLGQTRSWPPGGA